MRLVVRPSKPLRGAVAVPGDKSIAHRWLLLAATAQGGSELGGLPQADDVRSTAACVLRLTASQPGLEAWLRGEPAPVRLEGRGWEGLVPPAWPLDCGNSGTTMRLLAGVLAGRDFSCVLEGDESLAARPMERVAEPLRLMGAEIHTEEGHPPLQVLGGDLLGIEYRLPVPSAQVQGAVLLAGVQAVGETVVDGSTFEPGSIRDHTERALAALGAPVETEGGRVAVRAFQHPGLRGAVPGDPSAAAFLLAGAAILPGSDVEIRDVGVNPTRLAFASLIGATVDEGRREELGEPVGTLARQGADPAPIEVPAAGLPAVVDEVPALAATAVHAGGESWFRGAGELRVKESDRLRGLALGLRGLGGEAEVQGDDLVVGGDGLRGGEADSQGDHRLAMALTVAALAAERESVIHDVQWAAVSFPGFVDALRALGADVEVEG
ncbi:MAG TPA: 3-phosphoshikimate 1-carboxyvinyltransferase [Actinomycetota bacterium]